MAKFVLVTPKGEYHVSLLGGLQPCYVCNMEGLLVDETLGGVVPCFECDGAGVLNPREGVERPQWEKLPPVNNPEMYDKSLFDLLGGQE